MRRTWLRLAVGILTVAVLGLAAAPPVLALQFNVTYDGSVTSRSDYSQIKSAFGQATDAWSNVLTDNATINLRVSFGSVGNYILGPNTLGGSLDALYGYFSYQQMKSWLSSDASSNDDKTAVKSLPAGSSVTGNTFVLASAQAKALGLISGKNTAYDGYVGFGSATKYDYDRTNGISTGYFDFVGLAEHEIAHVLGLFSGVGDGYATAFDLFRCSGGASSFTGGPSYFSIDGCKTNLVNFNSTGSGDRDDWASGPTSTDIRGAFLYPGVQYGISAVDLTALDVIGWGTKSASSGGGFSISLPNFSNIGRAVAAVPEASTLTLLGVGLVGVWLVRRFRSA